MADLLLPAAEPTPLGTVGLALPAAIETADELPDASQIVFKVNGVPPSFNITDLSGVEALQRLVTIIEELRSPASGWSANIPQTAETLAPYVSEEAHDALEALQRQVAALDPVDVTQTESWFAEQSWQHYMVLKACTPWLLWCVARSAYDVMQLLEGVVAKACQPDQDWQYGILRLVPLLNIETANGSVLLDLATSQTFHDLLAPDVMIQADDCAICQQPTAGIEILSQLIQQTQAATPFACSLFTGMSAEILIPRQGWQSGTLTLQLALEFISAVEEINDELGDRSHPTLEVHLDDIIATSSRQPTWLTPLIKFTDAEWLDRYMILVMQHQIKNQIAHLPTTHVLQAAETPVVTELVVVQLIDDACDLANSIQHSLVNASCTFPQNELRLDDVMARLLWMFNRSTYAVMQLMSGVSASVLQPESDWQRGLVRLQVGLHLQMPEGDRHLDLATGQLLDPAFSLSRQTIIQFDDHQWFRQPILLNELLTTLKQQIEKAAPDVSCFFDRANIAVLGDEEYWQPGAMYLDIDFEFVPLG